MPSTQYIHRPLHCEQDYCIFGFEVGNHKNVSFYYDGIINIYSKPHSPKSMMFLSPRNSHP